MFIKQTEITPIKTSYLFSNDKFSLYLVVNYDKKTFTIKQTGFKTSNETSFIFKDTQNDTRGLLQLMIEAQEFALAEIGEIKVRDTRAEAEWDATLTGTGYYKKREPNENLVLANEFLKKKLNSNKEDDSIDSTKYCRDYIDKLYTSIANQN